MTDPKAKEELMYSLKKGNAQQITVLEDGHDTKYFISANPQFKTIDLYDDHMKKIKREVLLKPESETNNRLKFKAEQKVDLPAKKQSRNSKMRVFF